MSRPAQRAGAPAARKNTTEDTDICPVCKSSRYLNPHMRFLVNPECYHKMCESCVDRIFSHGPAPCPLAGCRRTLRKHRFRPQTFEDVAVEREVDVRRRVAAVMNRREDDFVSLRAYNDYLGLVEDMIFDLVNGSNVEETERKLQQYARENAEEIAANKALAAGESQSREMRKAAEAERARQAREAARREEEEERRAREEGKRDVLNLLARGEGGDAVAIVAGEARRRVALKKSSAQQHSGQRRQPSDAASHDPSASLGSAAAEDGGSAAAGGFHFAGLKKKIAPQIEKPYDPFDGGSDRRQYVTLQDEYEWDWLERARGDIRHTAGGYDFMAYCSRALCDAFSGLGVLVAEEVAAREGERGGKEISTAATADLSAGAAAVSDANMDDVF